MCLVAPVATGLCKGAQAARVCSLTESRCLYTIAGTVPCAPYQKQGGDVRWGSKSAKLKLSTTCPLLPPIAAGSAAAWRPANRANCRPHGPFLKNEM
jgi:hypothetical protein